MRYKINRTRRIYGYLSCTASVTLTTHTDIVKNKAKKSSYFSVLCTICCLLGFFFIQPVQAASQPKNAENNDAPVDGDRIVFGSIGEASNLIPYITADSASHEIADLLYISPLRYNKNLEVEPYAAESFSVEDEGRLLRFTLRKGMLWEDGVEITAEDVEYTWKIVCDPATGSPYAQDFQAVKEFTVTGRYSFEVRYDKFYTRAMSAWMSPILPKHILQGQNIRSTPFSRKPVGAGAYRLKQWEPGSRITLAASPTYFKGKPHIAEQVYRIIPDASTLFMEGKAGKVDVLGLSPQQYLRQTSGEFWQKEFTKYNFVGSLYVFLGFNLEHPVFKDVRVRRAISLAINRDDLVKGVLMGQGTPANGPFKPGTWAHDASLPPVQQNILAAKALLAEAGFSDSDGDGVVDKQGRALAFTILTNQGNEQRILTATVIQAQLKAVGVKVQVRTVEWAAFIREFVNKGRFDAIILGWTLPAEPDPYAVWHSSQSYAGGLNMTHYRNAEVDDLLEAARTQPDQHKRIALYKRFQQILYEEQPYCFLYVPYSLFAVQSRFHGIQPALAGILYNMEEWWVPRAQQKYTLAP
ncbi:MAG: peptide-binding protein [Desulfovibrionaceae bacterium]|nr:peptide-binding protein [Desulfovibrionaceae bacterium]